MEYCKELKQMQTASEVLAFFKEKLGEAITDSWQLEAAIMMFEAAGVAESSARDLVLKSIRTPIMAYHIALRMMFGSSFPEAYQNAQMLACDKLMFGEYFYDEKGIRRAPFVTELLSGGVKVC